MKDNPFYHRNSMLVIIIISVLVMGLIDYATGCELGFFLFYLIAIAAWKVGTTSSYLISLLGSIVWFLSDMYAYPPHSTASFAFWNGIIRLFAFLTVAYSTSKIQLLKKGEPSQDRLSQDKTLNGLLPICASCKKIRDSKGRWQRVEEYVEQHTNAHFTHGLCQECSDKLLRESGIGNSSQLASGIAVRRLFRGRSQRVLAK